MDTVRIAIVFGARGEEPTVGIMQGDVRRGGHFIESIAPLIDSFLAQVKVHGYRKLNGNGKGLEV